MSSEAVIEAFEQAFPERVRCYFTLGSYADQSAGSYSDLDMVVLFAGSLHNEEEVEARQLATHLAEASPIRLDLLLTSEETFASLHSLLRVAIRQGSTLLHGEDVRASLPDPGIDLYTREVSASVFSFIATVMRSSSSLAVPFDALNPTAEFLGYTETKIAAWQSDEPTSKQWVALVTRIATALLALNAGIMTGSKVQSVRLYAQHIDDQWSPLIEWMYDTACLAWGYRLPDDLGDRQMLHQRAIETHALELYFVQRYREYLQTLTQHADSNWRDHAHEQLTRIQPTSAD